MKGKRIFLFALIFIGVFILLIAYLTNFRFFKRSRADYRSGHPYLLFTTDEINAIKQRIGQGGVVAQAFTAMKGIKTTEGELDEVWQGNLVRNSFYYALTDDMTAKNNALSLINKYTTGSTRYSFPDITKSRLDYSYSTGCNGLALSYDLMYKTMSSTEKNNTKLLLIEWGTKLTEFFDKQGWQANSNFYTGLISCVGLTGMTLEGEYSGAASWITKSKTALSNQYFKAGAYNPGGDYVDGHVYQIYGAGAQFLYAASYEKNKGEDLVNNTPVMNIWNFFTYALMSEKKFPRYGDNSSLSILNGEYLYILDKWKKKNDTRVPAWLWTWNQIRGTGIEQNDWKLFKELDYLGIVLWYPQGVTAANPSTLTDLAESQVFYSATNNVGAYPGGMASLRNGWEEGNNLTFWLINRYRWQGHEHYDPNAFVFSAYGEKLLTNENERLYNDPVRGKLSQQNSIMIDKAEGDVPKTGNYKTAMGSSLGKFLNFFTHKSGDLLVSDSRYPHADFSTQSQLQNVNGTLYWEASESKVTPILKAERSVAMIKQFGTEPYIVMLDNFKKDTGNHSYTWQSYLVPGHSLLTGEGTVENPIILEKGNALLKMAFITPLNFTKRILPADTGKGRADEQLEITQNNVADGHFLTLLLPQKKTGGKNFTIRLIQKENPTVVSVRSDSCSENIIIANSTGTTATYQDITTDATLLILNKKNNQYNQIMVTSGKSVTVMGKTLLQAEAPVSLTAFWQGTQLTGAGQANSNVAVSLHSFTNSQRSVNLTANYASFGDNSVPLETSGDNCDSNTADPTVTDAVTPTGDNGQGEGNTEATLNLKLNFQGVISKPDNTLNKLTVRVGLVGANGSSKTAEMVADNNGVWSGQTTFDIVNGEKYALTIKGPQHLQRKICDSNAQDSSTVLYRCQTRNLVIQPGSNNIDLSKLTLFTGDLAIPQNGIIDSEDISTLLTIINTNQGSTAESIAKADLNFDGIVDTQDYALVIHVMDFYQKLAEASDNPENITMEDER